jgi:Double zinc ribbon
MTKLCTVCSAENRDEAQFCRACGTPFAAAAEAGSFGNEPSGDNVCSECGFRNKPGIRYCANCGMGLSGASDEVPPGDLAPAPGDPYAGLSPPPISYASFATVAPYPPAPTSATNYPPTLDDTTPLDLPDADATIMIRKQEARDGPPDFTQTGAASQPSRAALVIGIVVLVLVVAGIAAWLFLGSQSSMPPGTAAVPAPVLVPPPVAPVAAPPVEAPAAVAAPSPASAAAPESTVVAPPPAAAVPAIDTPPPAAAAPLPQVTDPVPVESADAAAKRLAAEKERRDKAARDKLERDAKAKALVDQRDQAAAAARAEQDAQARRRAEEAQRARPSAASAPPAATAASSQARGVRESCAGRGTIAEAVCQSRLCAAAEHANEAICRQIREADERRRNLVN